MLGCFVKYNKVLLTAIEMSVVVSFWCGTYVDGRHENYGPVIGEVSENDFLARSKSWIERARNSLLKDATR